MKKALLLFLIVANVFCFLSFASGLFVMVYAAVTQFDASTMAVLTAMGIGSTGPALTAGVLFKTQLISSGETWGEIVNDVRPLLQRRTGGGDEG